jgi:proteasome lid subunit RPN8/RPN11
MIGRLIVHKSLIDSFKRKAVKAMPYEVIVAVLGKMVKNELHIYAFDTIEVETSISGARVMMLQYGQPEEEMEAGTTLKYYGTLHSHPNSDAVPSEIDKADFVEKFNGEAFTHDGLEWEYLRDEIMGIMSLSRKKSVIHYSLMFYNIDFEPIELIISETKKGTANEVKKANPKVPAKKGAKRKKG